jgi:hypothetical protein
LQSSRAAAATSTNPVGASPNATPVAAAGPVVAAKRRATQPPGPGTRIIGPSAKHLTIPGHGRFSDPYSTIGAAPSNSSNNGVQPNTTTSPQPIHDPAFELGNNPNPYWAQYSSHNPPFKTIDQTYYQIGINSGFGNQDADGGTWGADFCGYIGCNPDVIGQAFTVPSNIQLATISYYVQGGCASTSACTNPMTNSLQVGLVDAANNKDVATYHVSNIPARTVEYPYIHDSFDVTGYLQARAGQQVQATAIALTSGSDQSAFFVDDVTVNIHAVPDAPPTANVSGSASGQATVSWTTPTYEGTSSIFTYVISTYDHLRNFVKSMTSATSPATVMGLTNGMPYYFTVAAQNSDGTGAATPTYSVTPITGSIAPVRTDAPSTSQYTLPNSDGTAWQVMDEANLSLSITPGSSESVLLSANADLWTWNAGYNQDIGITVNGTLAAWKESGGFAGTFSPNAAFVETV